MVLKIINMLLTWIALLSSDKEWSMHKAFSGIEMQYAWIRMAFASVTHYGVWQEMTVNTDRENLYKCTGIILASLSC